MSSRRLYRQALSGERFQVFNVTVKETDLWVAVSKNCCLEKLPALAERLIWQQRQGLEKFLSRYPEFARTLEPCLVPVDAPSVARTMALAGNRVGVGPMAAVAGAFAEIVGLALLEFSPEVLVENGGDLFLKIVEPVSVGIFAGSSPLSGKIALLVEPGQTPLGICTSSGSVGPSFSRGKADAAVALSPSAPLADAAATALGNRVHGPDDLEPALEHARSIEGVTGAVLICGERMAAWGSVKLRPLT
jgi:uncharacterized protein